MSGGDDDAGASWLAGACPSWCVREHAEDDHPEDRYHQSEPSILPVVAGSGDAVPAAATLRSLTLVVRAGRYADDDLDWIVVEPLEDQQPRMVLTADAARRLVRGLRAQLAALTDG